MMFSLMARLYSMMTGNPFSSMPRVSMRPACVFPVEYSLSRNVIPRIDSRFSSMYVWRDFSSATEEP